MAYSLLRYMVLAKSPEEKLAYYRYAIRKSTIINVLLVVLVAVVGSLYPHPEKFSDARWLLPMLLLVLPFQNILDHTLYTHRAQFANKRFAVASLLSSVFVILARAFGGYVGDLFGVAVAVAAANALVGLLFMGDIRRTYFKGISPSVLSRDARSEASRYSLQYMATNSIWAIIMLNDIFLLGQLLGNEAIVADYKVAYVLPAICRSSVPPSGSLSDRILSAAKRTAPGSGRTINARFSSTPAPSAPRHRPLRRR